MIVVNLWQYWWFLLCLPDDFIHHWKAILTEYGIPQDSDRRLRRKFVVHTSQENINSGDHAQASVLCLLLPFSSETFNLNIYKITSELNLKLNAWDMSQSLHRMPIPPMFKSKVFIWILYWFKGSRWFSIWNSCWVAVGDVVAYYKLAFQNTDLIFLVMFFELLWIFLVF